MNTRRSRRLSPPLSLSFSLPLLPLLPLAALAALAPLACSSAPAGETTAQSAASALSTISWVTLGSGGATQLATATNIDGRAAVFALTTAGSVIMYSQLPNSTTWGAGSLDGTALKQIAVGHNADGRLELFAVGGNGALYHRWQVDQSNDWGGWQTLGGTALQQVAVGNEADGRLAAFALGGDGNVYPIEQVVPNGDWGTWTGQLGGGPLTQIATGLDGSGTMEVLGRGQAGAIWDSAEIAPNGSFAPWTSINGWGLQQLALGWNADGRIEAYVRGGDGALYHQWRTPAGSWSGWATLYGSQLQDIAVTNEADGRLDAFAVGGDGNVYLRQQSSANGGWGGNWQSFGGASFTKVAAARNRDGRIDLFAIGPRGQIQHTWETAPNGTWLTPTPPPPPCTPGGEGYVSIGDFNSPTGDGVVNLGDVLGFRVTATRWGASAKGSADATIDGVATQVAFDGSGVATMRYAYPFNPAVYVTQATASQTHTLSIDAGACGTITKSLRVSVATPTAPAPVIRASKTYVNVGDPVTLTARVSSFRPRDCQNVELSIDGKDGLGKPIFHEPNVSNGTTTVHVNEYTDYTATARCRSVAAAGSQTSPKVNVSVYAPPTNPTFFCFTITTPSSPSMPLGSCWAEAVAAADGSAALAIEQSRNGGNATIDELGACTSIPTNACPDPFE